MNRMFQVLPDQEENIYIGDMLSDDIIVVELDSSPVSTPECKTKILLSPVDGGEETFMWACVELKFIWTLPLFAPNANTEVVQVERAWYFFSHEHKCSR